MADHEAEQDPGLPHYGSAGGWGSVQGMARVLMGEAPRAAVLDTLRRQNKPGGHMCTSCAWGKPARPHAFEFCENGAKATIWDLTRGRCGPELFASRTVSELMELSDHELEKLGRLTHPMRYDPASDRYLETSWEDAFAGIGAGLRALAPDSVAFYASGRASLETSYLWQLLARVYGTNNLPDSSNMCHETTSVALKAAIGSPVGTCVLEDFEHCDLLLFFGQNTGSNSPRFLHPLQEARRRGCKVVTFNPVREAGLVAFRNPQDARQMTAGAATGISDLYLQVRPGGDMAALAGLIKRVLEIDRERGGGVLDRAFLAAHTEGLEAVRAFVDAASWEAIEAESGLSRAHLEEVAALYAASRATIGVYGMGLTQHVHGGETLGMLVNLLMLRGNLGRLGAGISPVRGHSNVQGQRTVGISEKPELVPLDRLAALFGFEPPRGPGWGTVAMVEALLDGSMRGLVSLGGNLARAIPDIARAEPRWRGLDLSVQIATKLNRSHLLPGREAWLLPCLVRAEEDRGATGPQWVSMEDSLSHIHGSLGTVRPIARTLLSEPAIVEGIARAALDPNPALRWDEWAGDTAQVRALIEATWPETFRDYERRMREPGGFHKGNPVRERRWETKGGRARFTVPPSLSGLGRPLAEGELTLITLRSNDQFNTTVYGFSDRLRGLKGDRMIVLLSPAAIARASLAEGERVRLVCAHEDGHRRVVEGLKVVAYDLPETCCAAYYPETNPLIPVGLHDGMSKTPAYKGVPVRIER